MQQIFIVAGCNGAGKTTAAYVLLPNVIKVKEFVNADIIAQGISPFNPQGASIEAGRIMLRRIQDLIHLNESFAFETTLATKSYVKLIEEAQNRGYKVVLLFFWLPKVELAIERVRQRVNHGGHHIPNEVIRRRYKRGLINFFQRYMGCVNRWLFFDNSHPEPKLIANHDGTQLWIHEIESWNSVNLKYESFVK